MEGRRKGEVEEEDPRGVEEEEPGGVEEECEGGREENGWGENGRKTEGGGSGRRTEGEEVEEEPSGRKWKKKGRKRKKKGRKPGRNEECVEENGRTVEEEGETKIEEWGRVEADLKGRSEKTLSLVQISAGKKMLKDQVF